MRDEELFYLYALLHVRRREELGLSLSEAAKRTPRIPAMDEQNGNAPMPRHRALHTALRGRTRIEP